MRLRTKLLAIGGAAAVVLAALLIVQGWATRAVQSRLTEIQRTHLPRLELGPDLDARFERLRRGFQDAVAAQDRSALDATKIERDGLRRRLDAARDFIQPSARATLHAAVDEYYAAAYDVSQRLIAGEAGEPILQAMAAMQSRQSRALDTLHDAARLDRREIVQSFADARRIQHTAGRMQLGATIGCLLLLAAITLWVSRDILASVREMVAGFERFGRGDLRTPMVARSSDEIGQAAKRANLMAEQLAAREEEIAEANRELEAFSYSVAHDLRAPLRSIDGFSQALLEDSGERLDAEGKRYLKRVRDSAQTMGHLIDDLLDLSRVTRADLRRERVDVSELAGSVLARLRAAEPNREVELIVEAGLVAQADPRLLDVVLTNLLGNAWKFTGKQASARIELAARRNEHPVVFLVRDNGAGFDAAYADKLFGVFQRLHAAHEFEGTGIGLATVQRIVRRHGGRVWADGEVGRGATFYFTLEAGRA